MKEPVKAPSRMSPTGFVIGVAEMGKLLLGEIVILTNKSERQCVLIPARHIPARHILAGQPEKETESYPFACL
jgi:hypothetical protein